MSSPAAWHTDPTGKHDHRWWDGTKWTEHVADAGESKIDHLAPAEAPPAPADMTPPPTSETATNDTAAMDPTSASGSTGDHGDAGHHTDPGTGGLSGAWEGTADPQPSQPGWQQPGAASHGGTAQQPSWQQPQHGQGGDSYAQQPAWGDNGTYDQKTGGTDGVAVAAMVIGILSLLTAVFVLGGLGGVIALVLGLVALGRIKRNRSGGRGMAITGIVTGVLSIIVAILVVVFSVSFFGDFFSDFEQCMQENDDEAFCTEQLEDGIMDRFGN